MKDLKEDRGTGDHLGPGVMVLVEEGGRAPGSDTLAHSSESVPMFLQLRKQSKQVISHRKAGKTDSKACSEQ